MSRASVVPWGGLMAMLGGALWIVLRPLVLSTWGSPVFGFDYGDYNRMMVAPLLLLLVGAVAFRFYLPASHGRLGRWGLVLVALGLATSLAGVIVEFWWAGGLRGKRQAAMLGWGIYGLGLLGQAGGLALFGFGTLWTRRLPGWIGVLALAMAMLLVLWLPMLQWQLHTLSILDQVLYGVGWMMLGYVLWSGRAGVPGRERTSPARPAQTGDPVSG
ncbi:MAG TPA: hypothetical protein VLA19_05980 [Herpetosiphonaceae bacterium]|nr:hypothetical protein [Herpetosiphonaceae bacterium]